MCAGRGRAHFFTFVEMLIRRGLAAPSPRAPRSDNIMHPGSEGLITICFIWHGRFNRRGFTETADQGQIPVNGHLLFPLYLTF